MTLRLALQVCRRPASWGVTFFFVGRRCECGSGGANPIGQRTASVRKAFVFEIVTAGWMVIEAAVAIGSGVTAHSFSLIAFGADSIVELLPAILLLWRLNTELRRRGAFPDETERRAARLAAAFLTVLIVDVTASAAWSFWRREGQEFSIAGLTLATLAIPIMYWLYWLSTAKLRLADSIGSAALRADAIESVACGYFSGIVVIDLLAQLSVGAR
jgi:divalent metal cation (Fe/Co/Zn/Cd) transporter